MFFLMERGERNFSFHMLARMVELNFFSILSLKNRCLSGNTEIQGMKTLLSKSMILRRSASRLMRMVSR